MAKINVPISVHGETAGTAQLFQKSFANMPFLLLAAILTIYITLGMLYESLIHPITIISTLPSAGVGAVLALLMFQHPVRPDRHHRRDPADRHREEERHHHDRFRHRPASGSEGLISHDAIYKACLLRFRPIMMTTTGAILGALPLAIGLGEGSELRQPLGISIVGGLFLSQILTLYTTPVVYLYMDRFGDWTRGFWNTLVSRHHGRQAGRSRADTQAVAGGIGKKSRARSQRAAYAQLQIAILQIGQIVLAPAPCLH